MKIPRKLRYLDLLIELSEVTHLSQKMKNTGKISRKVKKKWQSRCDNKNYIHKCVHKWLPGTVFKKYSKYVNFPWFCPRCQYSCDWVYTFEISQELATLYPDKVKTYE